MLTAPHLTWTHAKWGGPPGPQPTLPSALGFDATAGPGGPARARASVSHHAQSAAARYFATATASFARLITATEVRSLSPASISAAQRIYFANHTSHADFVLLWASLPAHLRAETHPVAAADYWTRGPIRRLLIEHVFEGVLIHRRGRHDPLSPMLHALDAPGQIADRIPRGERAARAISSATSSVASTISHPNVPTSSSSPSGSTICIASCPAARSSQFHYSAPSPSASPRTWLPKRARDLFLTRMRQNVIDLGASCRHC